jgi:hypothetical protein
MERNPSRATRKFPKIFSVDEEQIRVPAFECLLTREKTDSISPSHGGFISMNKILTTLLFMLIATPCLTPAQQPMKKGDKAWTELEATLRDANLEWLCQGKYYKPNRQDCVDSRAKFWDDQFFDMNPGGGTQTKAQMVAAQTAGAKIYPDVVKGEGPNPTEFKLMAVYNNGNFAMAVDHTIFKIRLNGAGQPDFDHVAPNNRTDHWYLDETGKLAVVREVTYARVFVKKDGKWRPAVGASATLPMSK